MKTKHVALMKNRKLVKLYCSLAFARRGMQALYNRGDVLPDDSIYMLWCGHRYYF